MKTIFNLKKAILVLGGTAVFITSCKKDKPLVIDPGPVSTLGVYVLCEGAFGAANNSKISYFNAVTNTLDPNYFETKNSKDLGTDATDLQQYGSKMYCVVTGAKTTAKDAYIEVISIATGKSIKRIPFYDDATDFSPRHIAFYQNKAYISGYDGYVTRIDTASLNIDSRVAVGGALEGIAAVNGKLYVANTSQPLYPNSNNSSVSVVSIGTFTKLKDIAVTFSPTKITATSAGDVLVISAGNYTTIDPALEKISSVTDTKVQTYTSNLNSLTIVGDKGFAITGDYPAALNTFNPTATTVGSAFVTDATAITTVYGVSLNILDNTVFVSDAMGYGPSGKVYCFGADGKRKFDFATAALPQTAVFNYGYK
jgi:hypothetical protein